MGETTFAHAVGWVIALAASVAALTVSFLLFFADREARSALFAAGGLALVLWVSSRLTARRPA